MSSPEAPQTESPAPSKKRDVVRRITMIVLVACTVMFVWYVIADKLTPYTDVATINSVTVPVTPQVSGYVDQVNIRLHSLVDQDEVMIVLDQRPYRLAVQSAEANVDLATQQMGVGSATVKAAASRLGVARAQLDRAQRNYDRTEKVRSENPGALSQADWDRTETGLAQATERVASAEADLEKAEEQLGVLGPENAQLRVSLAALEQAQLNLAFTELVAPFDGGIASFNIDVGHFAGAGQPLATLVSRRDVWIEAYMRENNLSRIDPGDDVEFFLDVAPGRMFKGTVRSVGYAVDSGGKSPAGGLPSTPSNKGWLRDPQRFPVVIGLNENAAEELARLGGQADVVVFTGGNALFNLVARIQMRVRGLLSYVR